MTDSAERLRSVPSGTFVSEEFHEELGDARDTVPDGPLRSYIQELGHRVDHLLEDEDALTVPPNATFPRWVAGDVSAALAAAAETIPRTPSSPDDPRTPPSVPAAELSPRQRRRLRDESVPDFPVELRDSDVPTLRTRDRGRTTGRFVLPTELRAASSDEGPIARALKQLVEAERRDEATASPPDTVERHAAVTEVETAHAATHDVPKQVTRTGLARVFSRAAFVFVVASAAGAAAVYMLLTG